jgi:ABC-2 type transport system ATP-binding protein
VTAIKSAGRTIILTTHYIEEAEILCDTVAIMDNGRIIDMDSPSNLLQKHGSGATIQLRSHVPDTLFPPGLCTTYRIEDMIEIHTSSVNTCIQLLAEAGVDLSGMTVRTPNLEDIFLHLTGHSLRT